MNTRHEWTREKAIAAGGPRAARTIKALLGREVYLRKQMIRDGVKKDRKLCPVALALLAVIPDAVVHANYGRIIIDNVAFSTPEKVEQFMLRFDHKTNRESISGFYFTLRTLREWYGGGSIAVKEATAASV